MDLKRIWMLAVVLSGCCVAASAQSDGNGSVIIHSGESATSSSEDSGVRVSGGVMAGLNLTKPAPVYPPSARQALVSGTIVLAVRIDKEGKVAKVTVVSGPEPLRDAAVSAVRRWTYKPYLLNGAAVVVSTVVAVPFNRDSE